MKTVKKPATTRFVRNSEQSSMKDPQNNLNSAKKSTSVDKTINNEDSDIDADEDDDDLGLPRENLSSLVPTKVLQSLDDKAWKVRNEGLQQLGDILKRHPRLTADIGDVLQALKARLNDSNKNLVVIALHYIGTLGLAIEGRVCRQFLAQILPEILTNLADNKEAVRTAVIQTLDVWRKKSGLTAILEVLIFSVQFSPTSNQ